MRSPGRLAALAVLALLGLAGCEMPVPGTAPPVPDTAPKPPVAVRPSPASEATRAYFAGVQQGLLQQNMLRTDRGGRDAPFTDRNLADNFIRIALYDEYATESGQSVARQTESRLRRWDKPVRLSVEFGASVPLAQQTKDRAQVAGFAAELANATGHPVSLAEAGGNFTVLILNEDERRAAAPRLRALLPGISNSNIGIIVNMPLTTFCLVYAFSGSGPDTYGRAIAVIRSEHPDLLRLSCIHEELAQGLGLANDSPAARPSIFNDDEEYALLTRQDALLLKMLYDPRLRPGMTPAQARPIVQTIAYELLGGES